VKLIQTGYGFSEYQWSLEDLRSFHCTRSEETRHREEKKILLKEKKDKI